MASSRDPLATPMMKQYLATKEANPNCMLFMRMGDFYEIFLDDAVQAAKILGITLTSRNKGNKDEVPMAGVPHHSLAQHIPKLLAAGCRVAIMDQLEDPKTAKGLVKRGLTRIITRGTLIEDELLEPAGEQVLVAITSLDEDDIGIAALDIAGGRFECELVNSQAQLALSLARLNAAEILVPQNLYDQENTAERLQNLVEVELPPLSSLSQTAWHAKDARSWLQQSLQVGSLDGFGIGPEDQVLASACAAALRYARHNAGSELQHVRRIRRVHSNEHLILDGHCRRTLELVRNQHDGSRRDTLLSTVDNCRTAPGSRLLAGWLQRPLRNQAAIEERQDSVATMHQHDELRSVIRSQLDGVYDLERLLGRVATGRANGRDLVQLASSLNHAQTIARNLESVDLPHLLQHCMHDLLPAPGLAADIADTLVDEPPMTVTEGGLVRAGIDDELDELRSIRDDAGTWLARYQTEQATGLGLKTLKVGYNKVFGYYIELGKQYADKVPPHFTRKQTLVNAERYITPELKEYEDKLLGAEDRIRTKEKTIFDSLRESVAAIVPELQACADALSRLDVVSGLAEVARKGHWCRPHIDESSTLSLTNARHPVVEKVLGPGRFVANDSQLDAEAASAPRLAIITGPNMAGKSTYIRQVALAIILAQAGSYIPADAAHIGIVDRLFTRIGAGDELARNLSTFMVEMAETAAILNNATNRSLVVLDEVGRGTSTFDGLSLAWAITEYLHNVIRCRSLFATHYHELTELAGECDGIHNLTVAVAEQDDEAVFLHRIENGAATKSYGIHVADLAGVPKVVVDRAKDVLVNLEDVNLSLSERERPQAPVPTQLSIFGPSVSATAEKLAQTDLDNLSPKQAWDLLEKLQRAAKKELGQ